MGRKALFGVDYVTWVGPARTVGRGAKKREDVDPEGGEILYLGSNRSEAERVFEQAALGHRRHGAREAWLKHGDTLIARSSTLSERKLSDVIYRVRPAGGYRY